MEIGSKEKLKEALQQESARFEKAYLWIQNHLPPSFFEDVDAETLRIVTHQLMGFDLQNFFSHIMLKNKAIALCLDEPEADIKILKNYRLRGIQHYRTFVSNAPPPFPDVKVSLRVAMIHFSDKGGQGVIENEQDIFTAVQERHPDLSFQEFQRLLSSMGARFLRSLTKERLILAFDVLIRAKQKDPCQLEIRKNEEWAQKKEIPSLQIVLAWKNVPKQDFLYRLARLIYRHGLTLKRVAATYIAPYERQNILVMSLGLHGIDGKSAWETAHMDDFLGELMTIKYFQGQEAIETTFVDSKLMTGNMGNIIKTMAHFIHQVLVYKDPYFYSFSYVEEGLCRHPELTCLLAQAFEKKFNPALQDLKEYRMLKERFLTLVEQIDTGQEANDLRRKHILKQGLNWIDHILKTNVYRPNKTAFSFRLDPAYLDHVPFNRAEKFSELPFAVFFMKGMDFIGFHIRFRDLARGGLRTVFPDKQERYIADRNTVFSECYNLAFTQQKKNKDIPEGGSKGIILLSAFERLKNEEEIYRLELENESLAASDIEEKLKVFKEEQRIESLHQAQRSYIESFLTLLNCESDGKLRAHHIVDYYQKPEYIYLGPDENMHNEMIVWISNYAKSYNYKPGTTFMSSKPGAGINHKEYGVTSRGVNIYMEEILRFIGIDPAQDSFRIKMTGGPDGDVAGNQMLNLARLYPQTAHLVATTDISGTMFDPEGLDLNEIKKLVQEGRPIRFYPPEKLHEGGFLLDIKTKREERSYNQQTLLIRKRDGRVSQDWISLNEMNHLLRHNVHQVPADIFIPCGGRPRTLNENNYQDFLDDKGHPTARAIIEGGNLYLSQEARVALEKAGTIIIKDSSANKGGVICSSFEVLAGLVLSEQEFIEQKEIITKQILDVIESRARDEAQTLLSHFGSKPLTQVSEDISQKINSYTDELFAFLKEKTLSLSTQDLWTQVLLNYALPVLRERYSEELMKSVPDIHKKAMMACFVAQRLVYRKGLDWAPSILDILPLVLSNKNIVSP